jgi:diaminopropionate ammonia-lyase
MTPPARLVRNRNVDRAQVHEPDGSSAAFHATLPGFVPTPLRTAPGCAERLGVRSVHVKDEAERLGMPAFKILGASWASYRAIMDHLGRPASDAPSLDDLQKVVADSGVDLTLVAATDGNHGRAVARMARLLDCSSIILVPQGTVESRIAAIAGEGADVRVVDGNYDEAIAASAALADDTHLVISDTSWDGYTSVPKYVIDGYQTMLGEVVDEITAGRCPEPTIVVAQMGVGAFSSAVAQAFAKRPARLLVGVEPTVADCVATSVENGRLTVIEETPYTSMAGLNCGTPSVLAWADNLRGFDVVATVEDADAEQATRALHTDGIDAGESGAAGLAGLLRHGGELGLGPDDDILVFVTEGVTDPVNFARILGQEGS